MWGLYRHKWLLVFFVLLFTLYSLIFFEYIMSSNGSDIPQHLYMTILVERDGGDAIISHVMWAKTLFPVYRLFDSLEVGQALRSVVDFSTQEMMTNFLVGANTFHVRSNYNILAWDISQASLLNLHLAAVFLLSLFSTLTTYVFYRIVSYFLPARHTAFHLTLAVTASMVSSIFVPTFNHFAYLGQWGPTIWHNPTTIMLKPFAAMSFILFWLLCEHEDYQDNKDYLLLLAGVTAFGALIKPTFAIVFIPAAVAYALMSHRGHRGHRGQWKLYGRALLVFAPAVAVLGVQFYQTFMHKDVLVASSIVVRAFAVWKIYSPNIIISLMLSLLFPVTLLVMNHGRIIRSDEARQTRGLLLYAWLMFAVGFCQGAFLAESGGRFMDANFFWGYNISLHFLFLSSIIELGRGTGQDVAIVRLAAQPGFWREKPLWSTLQGFRGVAAHAALLAHVLFGFVYLARILIGHDFH